MNKILGIFGLLVFVCLFTGVLVDSFDSPLNLENQIRMSAMFGIISIGVAFVIITGGIDLSIGSVICLCGVVLSRLIIDWGWSVPWALAMVMGLSLAIGLLHGVLITKLKLQPFVVTLCGLLVYRGFARWFAQDRQQGFGQDQENLRLLATGQPFTMATLILAAGILFAAFFAVRAVLQYRDGEQSWKRSLASLGFAVLFAVAASSRFWVAEGESIVLGGKFYVGPASLMLVFGLLTFIPLGLWFIRHGLLEKFTRCIVPVSVLTISSVLFAIVVIWIAPTYEQISAGEQELRELGMLTMKGSSVRNLILLIVFLATGALIGSVGWVANTVSGVSESAKNLLPLVVTSGVLLLLGMTTLPETRVPMPFLIMAFCTLVASIFLNQTIFGRYLLALGRNEEAARYSGINTDNMIILAYVICAGMAGLGAILFALDVNNMQPASHGNIYELYAIAGAVLGGCSLRGGEGSIVGVIIGSAVMRILYNMINVSKLDTKLEWVVIGVVILTGVIADEVVKRAVAAKRAKVQAETS